MSTSPPQIAAAPPRVFPSNFTLTPYRPLFRSGDLQTVAGRFWPISQRQAEYESGRATFETAPDTRVLGHWFEPPQRRHELLIVGVHGLTSGARAPYMRAMLDLALRDGFRVLLLNVRNCGGTESWTPTLYHSGLTHDLRVICEQLAPQPLAIIGYSMGGNQAAKLAGEWGDAPPAHVRGVVAISAPIDLARCSRRIGERRNWVYEYRFVRDLSKAIREKQRLFPDIYADFDTTGIRTIWDFDDRITAPAFGYRDAADYYANASALRYLHQAHLPVLLLHAADDPFIPAEVYDAPVLHEQPALRTEVTPHGGHVFFLSKEKQKFWAAEQALSFAKTIAPKP